MRVLLLRFSSIGDILLTSPVVRTLHEQLGAEVHFLTKSAFRELVAFHPHIHRVHLLPDRFGDLVHELRALRFDAVVDLHHNLRTARLRAALRGPRWYRFQKLNWKKWLLVRLKIDRLPRVHIVDRYLAAAAPLGVTNDGRGLDFYIDPGARVDHPVLHEPFLAVAMGAAHATKQIPVPLLARALRAGTSPVVLLGGPQDRDRAARLLATLPDTTVVDFCGKLSLSESARVLSRATCLLTPDTGLMHLATALRVPVVSVWGNTVPAFGMYPYRPDDPGAFTVHEVAGLSCRPCSKIGFRACPRGHFRCMHDQSPERWLDAT